jgi:hypothetical protein
MMSLAGIPPELLIDIVEYLRPNNTSKPITGLNAAWKPYIASTPVVNHSESEGEEESESESEDEKEPDSESVKPLSSYASLSALAS